MRLQLFIASHYTFDGIYSKKQYTLNQHSLNMIQLLCSARSFGAEGIPIRNKVNRPHTLNKTLVLVWISRIGLNQNHILWAIFLGPSRIRNNDSKSFE